MNALLENAKTIFTLLAGLGVFAGGLGFLFMNYKKGGKEAISAAEELREFWQKQAEGYKLMNEENTKANAEKFELLNEKIGKIQGQLDEKSKQAEEYLEILRGKDPKNIEFQKLVTQSCADQANVSMEIVKILKDIHAMATAEHERDFKLTATLTKS